MDKVGQLQAAAAKWVEDYSEILDTIRSNLRGKPPSAEVHSQLADLHYHRGMCPLVIEQNDQPAMAAYRTALTHWLQGRRTTLISQSVSLLEMASFVGDLQLARRVIVELGEDPPAWQSDPMYSVARLLIHVLTGEGDPAPHRHALRNGLGLHVGYQLMLSGIMENSAPLFQSGVDRYLEWHRKAATKGNLKGGTEALVAMGVVTCMAIAQRRNLPVQVVSDPYVPNVRFTQASEAGSAM